MKVKGVLINQIHASLLLVGLAQTAQSLGLVMQFADVNLDLSLNLTPSLAVVQNVSETQIVKVVIFVRIRDALLGLILVIPALVALVQCVLLI